MYHAEVDAGKQSVWGTQVKNNSKRILWIDIAKAIGIMLVIVGHTFLNESPSRKLVFSFHMPLFFIVAGYTFRVKPTKAVVSSSFGRLIVPYMLIFASRAFLQGAVTGTCDAEFLQDTVLSFIYASGTVVETFRMVPPAGLIWFLVVLFCSRLVLNVATGLFERRGISIKFQTAFWFLFAFLGICIGEPTKTIPALSGILGDMNHIKLPLSFDLTMVACFFMFIGYVFKRQEWYRLLDKWWTFPIALAFWLFGIRFSYLELAARAYDMWACSLIAAFAGTFLVCWISRFIEVHMQGIARPFVWIGANSMLLYCIHAYDSWFAQWSTLPIINMGVPCAFLVAGLMRFVFDLTLALLIKRIGSSRTATPATLGKHATRGG